MARQTKLHVAGENAETFVRAIGHDATLCLRESSKESKCNRCVDICPGHAVRVPSSKETPGGVKLTVSKGFCVDCGLCCAVCPTGGLTIMEPAMRTLRRRLRKASQVAPQDGHVYLTCVETGLAQKDPSVVELACLGMLSWEMWANLMLDFPNLGVYLPGDLCGRCKAKKAEGMIVDAVCHAQEVVGHDVTLVETMRELDFTNSVGAVDPKRAEAFSGVGSGLAGIVKDITAGSDDDLPSDELGQLDARKMRIRLRKEIMAEKGEGTPGLKDAADLGGTLTQARWAILDAAMRFPEIAERVELDGVQIDATICAGGASEGEGDGEDTTTDCAACADVCPLGALVVRDDGGLAVRDAICVGCGLCVEACAKGAITPRKVPLVELLGDGSEQ